MGYIVKYGTYFFVENFCVGNFVIETGIAIQKTPLQMHFSARKFGKVMGEGVNLRGETLKWLRININAI